MIKGISEVTALKLLNEFKSVKQIKETSLEELSRLVGPAKGKLVWEFYREQNQNS